MEGYLPAIEITRGGIVESVHFGALAVVDSSGQVLASYGDIERVTFLRSAAKPFQALPFVELDGDQAFNLSAAELALMCASHSGTDRHVEIVQAMQRKVGVSEADLLCGSHPPYHEPTAQAMLLRGEPPTPLRNNCSGKHTGMLAHARLRGWPAAEYVDPGHPVQQAILQVFAEMCGLEPAQVVTGVDGCSAPNFAVPLHRAALAYARLVDPQGLSPQRAASCRRITRAMMAHPDMVAGPDRFDTQVMGLAGGRLLAKAGAEGYQGIGLPPGTMGPGSPGVGIALKIADGDLTNRARPCLAVELLRQLGVLSAEQAAALDRFGPHPLTNWQKIQVGEVRLAEAARRELAQGSGRRFAPGGAGHS
jgi:L-asparaginase II